MHSESSSGNEPRKVLAITSELPWPLNTGGHIRSFHIFRSLAKQFDLRVLAGVTCCSDPGIERLRAERIDVCPVELADREPQSEMKRVLNAVLHREPCVMFRRHDRPEFRLAVRQQLANQTPDLVYLDHLDPFSFRDLFPESRIVCDLHNVYSTLAARVAEERRWPVSLYLRREAKLLSEMEQAVAQRASTLMTVSAEEQTHFRGLGAGDVHLVPNGVDCAAWSDFPVGRAAKPPVILYLGALSWQPNAKAAEFLARDVMPQILARHPDAKLTIVGRNPGPDVKSLATLPGVELHADVPDVVDFLKSASLMAVPLDSGGGTLLKILEAFAAGLPVVSTPIGAEGIECAHGEHLWIGEREAFAKTLLDAISSPQLATRFADRARLLAETKYDWPVVGRVACRAVAGAIGEADGKSSTTLNEAEELTHAD